MKSRIHNLQRWLGFALLALALLLADLPAAAQTATPPPPSGPIYIVQPYDTLWSIALRFGVSITDLQTANNITDAGQVSIGSQLVIPGLEGVQGYLVTREVPYGETLTSLARRYGMPVSALARLNRITNPGELYAGADLIISESSLSAAPPRRAAVAPGKSLLELAAASGTSPWSLAAANELPGAWAVLPGDVLFVPGAGQEGPGALPDEITASSLAPLPLVQGKTAVLMLSSQAELALTGRLGERELHFFRTSEGEYVAIQGVHAMQQPGLYPLQVQGTLPDGSPFGFSQMVFIIPGGYIQDLPLVVDPESLDPAITGPEEKKWLGFMANPSPEKLWDGAFKFPSAEYYLECYPSIFGRRRSYNDSGYIYYHTGLDVCGHVGDDVYAPADGVVVFAGPLNVRGNALVIDHGWGIFTGYMHLDESLVEAGQKVKTGDLIAHVGNTGRVTGPHLHFEVWAGGVAVDPMDWLGQEYP